MQHKRKYKYRGYTIDIFIDDEANVNVNILSDDGELVDGAFKNTTQAEEYINELVFQAEGVLITGGSRYGYTSIRTTKDTFSALLNYPKTKLLIVEESSNSLMFLGNEKETE